MKRRTPRSTRTETLLPNTTLFRSDLGRRHGVHLQAAFRRQVPQRPRADLGRHQVLDRAGGESGDDQPGPGLLRLDRRLRRDGKRSEEHTSELQSLMRISYAVFGLKKKN